MILYPAFYKRHGVLRFDQLSAPRLAALNLFELPRQSLLQYWPMNDFDYGPDLQEFWVLKADGQIFIDHVTAMTSHTGTPRSSQVYPKPLIMDYRKTHRRFRPLLNLDTAARDDKTIIVRNYGIIPHLWRYRTTMLTGYQQWFNLRDTFWKGVEQWGQQSDRQQYVFFQLPNRLPTKAEFQKANAAINRESLKAFNTPDALNLLDLWQWIGDERENSLMQVLSEDTLERLNLVFIESGKFSVMNLGMVNKWRKASKEELSELSPEEKALIMKEQSQGKGGGILQIRLFSYVNNLLKLRSVAASSGIVEATDPETGMSEVVAVVNADSETLDEPVGQTVKVQSKSKDTVIGNPASVKAVGSVTGELKDAPLSGPQLTDPSLISEDADVATVYLEDEEGEVPDLSLDIPDELHDVEEEDANAPQAISAAAWAKLGVVPNPMHLSPTQNFEEYASGVVNKAKQMADLGLITGPQYKAFERMSRAFERIPNPFGTGNLQDMATIHPAMIQDIAETEMPDADTILDKSMLKSTLVDYDERYIKNLLPRNITQMALQIQNMGIAVTDLKVERVQDVMGATDQYSMKVVPVSGAPSTVKFSLPVVQPNGVYMTGGVRYRLRRQRGDMPIRKVSSNRVALTSYYGKLFVIRGERVVQNYGKWLKAQIQAAILAEGTTFSDVGYGKHLYTAKRLPRAYTVVSEQFGDFSYGLTQDQPIAGVNRIDFHWTYKHQESDFGQDVLTEYNSDETVVVGVVDGDAAKGVVTMDMNDNLYLNRPGKTLETLGTLEDLFGFDLDRAPVEYCEIKVFGKPVQVGFVLAYYYGLGRLCKMLGVEPRRVPRGGQLNLQKDEWVLRFADETLVFDRNNRLAVQVLAGLKTYQRFLSNYSVLGFDNPEIYGAILSATGLGHKYMRELDIMRQMFVDHITKDLLIMQNEPTNFPGLLMRSCELLLTDDTPDETDHLFQIEKGYERFAGAVYAELVKGVRSYYAAPATSRASIAIPYTAVFQAIQNDSAQQLVEDSNPIHNLKEKEAVTFNGTGGRSGRTMAKRSRVFHPNDRGIISEATVDNSDVAVNTYLSANPKLTSLYGTVGKFDDANDGITRQLSTSALVSPSATNDDPKRVNFINIQHSSGVSAKGYVVPPLLTGYEQIIPHRVDGMFATTAKADGVVTKRDRDHIVVSYPGTNLPDVAVRLGTQYGAARGSTIPHQIRSDLRTGDTVKVGDAIAYNSGFFTNDPMNKGRVMWMPGALAATALMETVDTTDDSSAISEELSERLSMRICKVRTMMVNFDQAIRNIVEPGDKLTTDSILCHIEDPLTASYDLFEDTTIDTLRILSANTPRAKYAGTVDKVEVIYNGAVDDMSPTLRDIAEDSDARRTTLARKVKGTDAPTGQVSGYGRIDGTTLEPNTLAIRVYILADLGAGAGDKAVFGNQLKTVIRRVLSGRNQTESGQRIDAIFGYTSIDNRIVVSPTKIGTTNTTLIVLGKRAAAVHRGEVVTYRGKQYGSK